MNPVTPSAGVADATALSWKIDECAVYFDRMHLRGWAVHRGDAIVAVEVRFEGDDATYPLRSYGQSSPDVAAAVDPTAQHARFDEWVSAPVEVLGRPFSLLFRLASGKTVAGSDALTNCAWGDPYFQIWEDFIGMLERFESGAVLELGSRARSAITRNHRVPKRLEYVGLDILPGPNVDVVGDAHALTELFPQKRFVAVFSASVFEHLAMPWKVAVEINRVLAPGGIVYTASHQTWPVHEEPWDFWRFSSYSWGTLFNAASGFELVQSVVGEPARVHACRTSPVTRTLSASVAYLGSACIARKVGDTELLWPVPTSVATKGMYPAGELFTPPTKDRA